MKPIPQFEIPFADGDTFALVAEQGQAPERIEALKRADEEAKRQAKEFHERNQITFT